MSGAGDSEIMFQGCRIAGTKEKKHKCDGASGSHRLPLSFEGSFGEQRPFLALLKRPIAKGQGGLLFGLQVLHDDYRWSPEFFKVYGVSVVYLEF